MNTRTPIIIFSGNRQNLTENSAINQQIAASLETNGCMFARGVGKYQGQFETCFMVVIDSVATEHLVRKLARDYNQESILCIDANRHCTLEYLDTGDLVDLGKLVSIGYHEAESYEAYSKFGNRYYVCSKTERYSEE